MTLARLTAAGTASAVDRHSLAPVAQRRDWSGWIAQWLLEHQGDLARAAQTCSADRHRSSFSGECQRTLAALLELTEQRTLVTVASTASVADVAGLSVRQVRRSLDTLTAAGWIESCGPVRTGAPGRPTNGYRLTLPGLLESVTQRQQRTSDDESAPAPAPAGQVRRWSGWIAQWLLEHQGDLALTGSQRRVLLTLASYADADTLSCFPSQDTLAVGAGMVRRSVRRTLEQLEERGLVRRVRTGTGRRQQVRYWLTIPALLEEHQQRQQAGVFAPVFAPLCAKNLNTQLQVPTSVSSKGDSDAARQDDSRTVETLMRLHLLECPPAQRAGQRLLTMVRWRAVEALRQAHEQLQGDDESAPDHSALRDLALALMREQLTGDRLQGVACMQQTGPTPEQLQAAARMQQTGQVLLEAGLLEDYQAWCAGRIDRTELVRLVQLIAAGKAGHAHASDDAQAWLLEHQGDDESAPAVA